jgi:hypothetical protein
MGGPVEDGGVRPKGTAPEKKSKVKELLEKAKTSNSRTAKTIRAFAQTAGSGSLGRGTEDDAGSPPPEFRQAKADISRTDDYLKKAGG